MKKLKLIIICIVIGLQLKAQIDSCKIGRTYFPSGKIEYEGCLKPDPSDIVGLREGIWNQFVEVKDKYYVRFAWTYKHGIKDGPYKAFFSNGKVQAIGRYTKGMLDDTLNIYNQKGELAEIEVWAADFKTGRSNGIKHIYKFAKPDSTIEKINGKDVIWMKGQPCPLVLKNKSAKK